MMPTIMNGEEYLNKSEAAAFLSVTFPTFSHNFEPKLQKYQSDRRRNVILFKKSDLAKLKENAIRPVESGDEK